MAICLIPVVGHVMVPETTAKGGLNYTGTTDPNYPVGLGTWNVDQDNNIRVYIYAKNAETTALDAGDPHLLVRTGTTANKWEVEMLADTTAEEFVTLCVPCADIAGSSYGWFQVYGSATVDYDSDKMTAEAWTAGCELALTAGKLTSQAAATYGISSVVAKGGAIALAAAAGTTDDTTRTIDLIGREAIGES